MPPCVCWLAVGLYVPPRPRNSQFGPISITILIRNEVELGARSDKFISSFGLSPGKITRYTDRACAGKKRCRLFVASTANHPAVLGELLCETLAGIPAESCMSLVDLIKATIVCGIAAFLFYSFPVLGQIAAITVLSLLWLSYARKTIVTRRGRRLA